MFAPFTIAFYLWHKVPFRWALHPLVVFATFAVGRNPYCESIIKPGNLPQERILILKTKDLEKADPENKGLIDFILKINDLASNADPFISQGRLFDFAQGKSSIAASPRNSTSWIIKKKDSDLENKVLRKR